MSNPVTISGASAKPIPQRSQMPHEVLALEVARALEDEVALPQYQRACARHDEQLIRRALQEVLSTPKSKIKRSRPALFFYLVKKYADAV